jgi:D-sedoheptulose 7-phosphate isomerase
MSDIFDNYADTMHALWEGIDTSKVKAATQLIEDTANNFGTIYVCGNGGSAAVANHLIIDFQKAGGIRNRHVRVVSLCHYESTSAIANDIGYAYVFSFPLESLARPGDILIAFSVSGNSNNITKAVMKAKELYMPIIGMTGFGGGILGEEADIHLNIPTDNYGMAEDFFQSMMHMIAQHIQREVR